MTDSAPTPATPWDEHNRRLLAHVRPPDWQNPVPASRYHLVVIGAGTAGLVTAAGAAGLGAKVALVEKHWLGGDCLNIGCVPSKSLLRAARAAHEARTAGRFGVRVSGVDVDFAAVMERLRAVRAGISPHDSAARFAALGVDVYLGPARFLDGGAVDVAGTTLRFKRAVIATGARATVPDVPGLREAGVLTNENVFNLTALPRRLAVVGGGPIGCELAQAFQRLGSQVMLFHGRDRLLPREDADASRLVHERFQREGMQIHLETKLTRVTAPPGGGKCVEFTRAGRTASVEVDEILIGTGRAPAVDGLNLEGVGVAFDRQRGVQVDDQLRTTHPRIFAAGDVCLRWKFTHAADFAARIVIQNALFLGRKKVSALNMPWSTYTDPEVAHVGLYESEAQARGLALDTYTQPFEHVDRAITDGDTEGFVKIHCRRGTGEIVGATIVGPHAGDLISEVSVAMAGGVSLGRLANVIHPYPTLADAIRRCGDSYNRTRLTPTVKQWMQRWLAWTR